MALKLSKSDLVIALRAAENERDCWQQVAMNPEAEFSLRVEVPDTFASDTPSVIEHWTLHATHRMSGPVLRIEHPEGAVTVRFLMDYRALDCCYRREALGRCQRFHGEWVRASETARGIRQMTEATAAEMVERCNRSTNFDATGGQS